MRYGVLAVVVLVALAGCGTTDVALESPGDRETTTTKATEGRERTATAPPTDAATGTPTAESPNNPWREDVVTVAVRNEANPRRDFRPLVNETLAFWNVHIGGYTDYRFRFRYTADAEDADVIVTVTTDIERCGHSSGERITGCASVLKPGTRAAEQEIVTIEAGHSTAATKHTLRHEFGHLIGLDHDDRPYLVMSHRNENISLPDAADRRNPWPTTTLHVYVDAESLDTDRATAESEVAEALRYFNRSAHGTVPSFMVYKLTDRRALADIVVTGNSTARCTTDEGSIARFQGIGADGDETLEKYTRETICLTGIDAAAIGWHVAYWIGRGMGLSGEELPDVLRSASYRERRGTWWR